MRSALRDLGDDDTALHDALARAFLWQEAYAAGRAGPALPGAPPAPPPRRCKAP